MPKVQFGVLGPLLVRYDGADVPVRRGKQRAVLATLLMNSGRLVSVEQLVDVLWEENAPSSADVIIRNYVMRLRRDLGPVKSRIRTQPSGYLISVAADELDVSNFEALLESARAEGESGEWEAAASEAKAALALWRGEPLCDVDSGVLAQLEVTRLAELRFQAVEIRVEADLCLGRHAAVIAELEHLTAAHPLRENLHAQLMLALYRDGRQAEALETYKRARRVLIDELGAEPGKTLRDLQQRILSGDPSLAAPGSGSLEVALPEPETSAGPGPETAVGPGPAVPHQLPRAVSGFVGRTCELSLLSEILERADERPPGTMVISAIGGTAGVGKTALAVQWAHQVCDRFPDGQLYANLRGYDPGQPVTPDDVLAGFLRALEVPGERIPADLDERAAAFRSLVSGRRVLILLDNACEPDQVRPLLPGSSSCAVLVTSRDAMTGLVARDGAKRVDLDLLPMEEATRLLRELIGERADMDPAAVERLAECCCRLPLALRVAAELGNNRPGVSLEDLVAELADWQGRLDLLDADGDARTAVREVFAWSYRNLDADVARVFRLIGLHPGPDFDAYAAAALAGASLAEARSALGRLARAHLIQTADPGRYSLHDLLRDYARELATAQDSAEHRRQAVDRLFEYYVHMAATSAKILFPAESEQRFVVPQSSAALPPVMDAATAEAWLEAERASLVAIATRPADNGWPSLATTLSTVLYQYLDVVFDPAEAYEIHASARSAARDNGDREGEASSLNNLATVEWRVGRFRECADLLEQSLALYRELGDRRGEARVLGNLSTVVWALGRSDEALGLFRQALAMHREVGSRYGEAFVLKQLGNVTCRLGRVVEALGFLWQSLALYRRVRSQDGEAGVLKDLSSAYESAGEYREAAEYAGQALKLCRELGRRDGEADALCSMAAVDKRTGQYEEGRAHLEQALAIYRDLGDKYGESQARMLLGEILHATGELAEARTQYGAALSLAEQVGIHYERACAHRNLGRLNDDLGDPAEARCHWQQAFALYREMGVPEPDDLREQLIADPAPERI